MIAVNIQGGLGNQLFQYAFSYSLAKDLRTNYIFDYTYSFIVPNYFRINKFYIFVNKNKYFLRLNRYICKNLKANNYVDFLDCKAIPQSLLKKNNSYYDGFFQSAIFFNKYETEIRKRFYIRKKYQSQFRNKYNNIYKDNKILVIHIRRTDYLMHGTEKDLGKNDLSLPLNYYKNALSLIDKLHQYKIYVIGDDIEFAKTNFSYLGNVSFPDNHLIIDFQLIMNANVAIISNSTFAWWASFLNPKKEKIIIAPKDFLGFYVHKEFPNSISKGTCFNWIEVQVK